MVSADNRGAKAGQVTVDLIGNGVHAATGSRPFVRRVARRFRGLGPVRAAARGLTASPGC
jgi:hypothetical protein